VHQANRSGANTEFSDGLNVAKGDIQGITFVLHPDPLNILPFFNCFKKK